MNRLNSVLRAVLTALTAALMAGCSAYVLARAPGFAVPSLPVYIAALASAALVQAGREKRMRASVSAGAAAVLLIALMLIYRAPAARMFAAIRENGGVTAEILSTHSGAMSGVAVFAAALLGTIMTLLIGTTAGAAFALIVLLAAVLLSLTVNPLISVWSALPGLAAGLAAFGLNENFHRDGIRPSLAATAAVLTAAAMLLVPAQRVTWAPLENLASQVRAVVDDYAHFTEQRVAFSIGEKGYDHGVMSGDTVISVLGGRATPSEDQVMRVRTDRDVLLRGTVRRSYSGYSWYDDQAKSRYLYYDFTHRAARGAAFGVEEVTDDPAFDGIQVSVKMLEEGASTLFVPAHLESFEMDLKDAVYYNTAGEIFLTRRVQAGDAYMLIARVPKSDAALIEAARTAELSGDSGYAEAFENYTALPAGIASQVYDLSASLAQTASCAAEKAINIREYLAHNCRYTLDGAYPETGKDFVSWFLLESKEGYCSYFASAMTVMCRAVGLPARYVEGYYVRANVGGDTIVTGHNAHAWVEVYLNGLGWVAFDPTARAYEAQGHNTGGNNSSAAHEDARQSPFEDDSDLWNPPDGGDSSDGESAPNDDPSDGDDAPDDNDSPYNEPDPPEDDPDTPEDESDPPEDDPNTPEDESDSPKEQDRKDRNSNWWWILLLALAGAGAIAWVVVWAKRRLKATDPIRMSRKAGGTQAAALILSRANLNVLNHYGLTPESGETPEVFAARAVQSVPNADYEMFVTEVARSRYSGKPLPVAAVKAGRRAYAAFLAGLRPIDRLRCTFRRMLRGIGSTDVIP